MKVVAENSNELFEGNVKTKTSSGGMRVKQTPEFIRRVTTDNYGYKTLASIREPLGNACWLDSKGTEHSVSLESNLIRIKDNGKGMSHDYMLEQYATVGESTKSGNNDAQGGYGIGRLAVMHLNLEGRWVVKTKQKGEVMRRVYSIDPVNGTELLMDELEKADEDESGTEVIVTFDTVPFADIRRSIYHCKVAGTNKVFVSGVDETEEIQNKLNSIKLYEDSTICVYSRNPYSLLGTQIFEDQRVFYQMGEIAYSVPSNYQAAARDLASMKLDSFCVFLKEPIGSAQISISRESLQGADEGTKSAFCNAYLRAVELLKDKLPGVLETEMDKFLKNLSDLDSKTKLVEISNAVACASWPFFSRVISSLDIKKKALMYGLSITNSGQHMSRYEFSVDEVFGSELKGCCLDGSFGSSISNSLSAIAVLDGTNKVSYKSVHKDLRDTYKKRFGKRHSYAVFLSTKEEAETISTQANESLQIVNEILRSSGRSGISLQYASAFARAKGAGPATPKVKEVDIGIKGNLKTYKIRSFAEVISGEAPVEYISNTEVGSYEADGKGALFFAGKKYEESSISRILSELQAKGLSGKVEIFYCPTQFSDSKKIEDSFRARSLESLRDKFSGKTIKLNLPDPVKYRSKQARFTRVDPHYYQNICSLAYHNYGRDLCKLMDPDEGASKFEASRELTKRLNTVDLESIQWDADPLKSSGMDFVFKSMNPKQLRILEVALDQELPFKEILPLIKLFNPTKLNFE